MSLTPGVVLCRLFERTAKKSGKRYFAGRLGGASVALFDTGEVSDTQQPIWILKVSEPLERSETVSRKPDAVDQATASRGFVRENDSEIPF